MRAVEERAPLNEPTYIRVKRAIIGDLVSGQFAPGTHLTIDALTSRYAVSHMPIREALRQLEGEGILVSIAHRGFKIESITEPYIRNIYDIRVGIESMLAHRTAERVSNEELTEFRQIHEDIAAMLRAGSHQQASQRNVEFHKRVYATAGNPEAEAILEGRTRVVRTVADSLGGYTPEVAETIIIEHGRIVEALESKNPEAAGEAVFAHVTAARDRLLRRLARTEAFMHRAPTGQATP
jgi:DNA-binding GntR family transcriptional regulator